MATANKNGDVFTDECRADMLRQLAQAQARQQEYRILQALRGQDAQQARVQRLWKQLNLLLGANGMPPFTVHVNQTGREIIKDVEVEVVDTKSARKQLPPPRDCGQLP